MQQKGHGALAFVSIFAVLGRRGRRWLQEPVWQGRRNEQSKRGDAERHGGLFRKADALQSQTENLTLPEICNFAARLVRGMKPTGQATAAKRRLRRFVVVNGGAAWCADTERQARRRQKGHLCISVFRRKVLRDAERLSKPPPPPRACMIGSPPWPPRNAKDSARIQSFSTPI